MKKRDEGHSRTLRPTRVNGLSRGVASVCSAHECPLPQCRGREMAAIHVSTLWLWMYRRCGGKEERGSERACTAAARAS